MNIAIFGGSFNPVHKEHVNIVKAAIRALSLDKVFVVPTYETPKKECAPVSAQDRLNMCRLAFAGIDGVEVSDIEIQRGGVSYSYITCEEFAKKFYGDKIYFIVGADMLESFPKWKYTDRILNCVTIAACAREREESLQKAVAVFRKSLKKEAATFGYVGAAVSASRVRALAALGESISDYVPASVEKYIKERGLYVRPELSGVKNYLSPVRWQHVVRVAVCAVENCRRTGVDERSAITAAALHDCAKYLTEGSPELKGFDFPAKVPPMVVHQYSGAYVAEKIFGVSDENVLDAIRFHASGKRDMSALAKLIYLSDMFEEGRDFDGVENLRKVFMKDLDAGFAAALEHQIKYLKSVGAEIYPLTEEALDFIKGKQNDK